MMRILFISAFYPPHVVGGWEQLVQDVNKRLQARGHLTHVLTSTHGADGASGRGGGLRGGIERLLTLESDLYHYKPRHFLSHKRRLRKNLTHTEETIKAFEPDVIFIHLMWNLTRGVAWVAEQLMPGRVVYYVANDWPHAPDPHTAYWKDPAQKQPLKVLKQLLAPIPLKIIERENKSFALKFEHVLCVSQAIKNELANNAGIPRANMHVVYNGVETDLFVPPPARTGGEGLSLLYAGSLVSHKGVHTAIEAMIILAQKHPPGMISEYEQISLTIVGSGHPDYEAYLRHLVRQAHPKLKERVHFLGRVPRTEMPALLQKFDVLLFPSIWEEPLARMTQEAMASGLIVVGTLTGGTGELLVEGETGLTFEPEDAERLAQRILELSRNPDQCAKLIKNARKKVERQFDIRRMIDEIERYLREVTEQSPHTH